MTGGSPRAYLKILETAGILEQEGQEICLFVTNFVYEKESVFRKKSMSYVSLACSADFWLGPGLGFLQRLQYINAHSLIYRTALACASQLKLP